MTNRRYFGGPQRRVAGKRNENVFVFDPAAAELEVVVEEEEPRRFAGLDGEGGQGLIFGVELEHGAEVDIADYVYVVKEKGLVEAGGILQEEPGGFFEAAAGVEQDLFAGDFDAHAEVFVGFQIVDDHVGKVVDVDDDFGDAEGAQAGEGDFEQGAAGDFDEGFGASVGERAKARAEAGGEDHGSHTGASIRSARLRRRPLQKQDLREVWELSLEGSALA